MNFYTSCIKWGNFIYLRGVKGGKRFHDKIKYSPTLFTPTNKKTKYKTLSGQYAAPIHFDTIREAKEWCDEYSEVDNFEFFGNTLFHYAFISDVYSGEIRFDKEKIHIVNLDIEVDSKEGFPTPDLANQEVTAITLQFSGSGMDHYFVYGLKDFDKSKYKNLRYYKAQCEAGLLRKFLEDWKTIQPDVITGWAISSFDIPYLVNRIRNVFGGDNSENDLSPWGIVQEKSDYSHKRTIKTYELLGISTLDYLTIYRKFVPAGRENYTLNYISEYELQEGKLDYAEYESLRDLYAKDFQKYIEYNIRDVQLVTRLEEKLGFLSQIFATAYDAKVNYSDVLSQVRMSDTVIYNHLRERNYVIPQKKETKKTKQYSGGYVKNPIIGLHKWVASFDLNSLYPNIIVQWNISPETIQPNEFKRIEQDDDLLHEKCDLSYLTEKKLTMAANGHHFDKTHKGFLPEIIERMYTDRVGHKKKMLAAQAYKERILAEIKTRNL